MARAIRPVATTKRGKRWCFFPSVAKFPLRFEFPAKVCEPSRAAAMPRKSGDLEADIAEILNDCQKTFAAHRRGLAILKQLHADQPERFQNVRASCPTTLAYAI